MNRRKLRNKLMRTARMARPRLGLRDSDVILASFPKSGNTWMRFIWANIIAEQELDGRTVDFYFVERELAWNHDTFQFGSLEIKSLPRLIKTHHLFEERIFGNNRVVYIYRHPGDTLVSCYAFRRAKIRRTRVSRLDFSALLRDGKNGLPAWVRHMENWLPRATSVVRYEVLKEKGYDVVERVLRDLGIANVDPAVLDKAVERSSFENTRAIESKFGRPDTAAFVDDFKFTRKGATGDWRNVFDAEDVHYARSQTEHLGLGELWTGQTDAVIAAASGQRKH